VVRDSRLLLLTGRLGAMFACAVASLFGIIKL
jgi:hypothetical protein